MSKSDVIFQTIPFNELLYLKWGLVSRTGVVAHRKDSTFPGSELHSNKEFLDPNMEFVRHILNWSAESHSHKMILVNEGGGVLFHMYVYIVMSSEVFQI